MANNTSQHILNTSANLLGFCLIVLTSLHLSSTEETFVIDVMTSIVSVILTFSCIFSFVSIRTQVLSKEERLESIANILFLLALIGILIIIFLIAFNFI